MKTIYFKTVSLTIIMQLIVIVSLMSQQNIPGEVQEKFKLHPQLNILLENQTGPPDQVPAYGVVENGISLVGYLPITDNPVSDVWAHGNYAYVGGWGANTNVKVVDISTPSSPEIVAIIPSQNPLTSPQDLKVTHINNRFHRGDILIIGNDGFFTGGIQMFDISDPENPVLLSTYEVNLVHNVFPYIKNGRNYLAVAMPTRELFHVFFPQYSTGYSEFMILDITDPRNPEKVGEWASYTDAGLSFGVMGVPGSICPDCRGGTPIAMLHDISINEQGTIAYLAYWDLGLVLLDISEPESPTLISQTREPVTFNSDEGDAHIAVPAKGGNLVLVGDESFYYEVFAPILPWGFLRIFDTSDPVNPVQVGAFATPNTLTNTDQDRWSSIHNIQVRGNRAFISWYNEGIRVIDFTDPSDPQDIASFRVTPEPELPFNFWGIYLHGSLILASDVSGALYILKMESGGLNLASEASPVRHITAAVSLEVYPNPTPGNLTFKLEIPEPDEVSIHIYDLSGKVVRSFQPGMLVAGISHFTWDGLSKNGNSVPSGMYICKVKGPTIGDYQFKIILNR